MKQKYKQWFLGIILFFGVFFEVIESILACPSCSSAISGPEGSNIHQVALGYNTSILLMASAPFVLAIILFFFFRYSIFLNEKLRDNISNNSSSQERLA